MPAEKHSPTRKARKTLQTDPSRWTVEDLVATQDEVTGGLQPDGRRGLFAATELARLAPKGEGDEKGDLDATTSGLKKQWTALSRRERTALRAEGLKKMVLEECWKRWAARFGSDQSWGSTSPTSPWPWKLLGQSLGNAVEWARKHGTRGARPISTRTALVTMLDKVNPLGIPERYDGTARFLTVSEKTWISFLVGHWPTKLPRNADAADIFRIEWASIKQAQARHPLVPFASYEEWLGGWRERPVRRGVQGEDARRHTQIEKARRAGDTEKISLLVALESRPVTPKK